MLENQSKRKKCARIQWDLRIAKDNKGRWKMIKEDDVIVVAAMINMASKEAMLSRGNLFTHLFLF